MATDENGRAAAVILSNLGGFLVTASLAMLAIEGTLFVFVFGSRVVGPYYFAASIIAFIAFIFSIVFGGWGITQTAEQLAGGSWTLSSGGKLFSAQAGLAFLGLLCFLVSIMLSGNPNETDIQKSLIALTKRTQAIQSALDDTLKRTQEMARENKDFSERLQRNEQLLKVQLEQRGTPKKDSMKNTARLKPKCP